MRRAVVVALLFGCGINEVGEQVLDGSPAEAGDVVAIDVVKEAAPVVCNDAGVASCADAVAFRSPALFSPDAGAPCPAGYDSLDVVLSVPNAPTCGCNCTDAGAPSCDTTTVDYHTGAAGFCNTKTGKDTLSGSCTVLASLTTAGEYLQIDPPAPTGCGGGTSVPPATTNTNARLCTPQCASDESVCTAGTGLRACVSVVGSVGSCPPNYPSGPFYVGANPVTTCDTCSCVQQGDCSGSTVHLYSDTNCNTGDQGFPMDGTCHALTGGHIGSFSSERIAPNIKNAACKVTEGASHVTYGGNDFTVCCQ